ncbi:MAG: hypothetical protein JXL20_08810 [Deltaproteobacteria bacterium]|nr:hypothetical protein [Deltaproteobacteria bacterium]
MEEGFIENRAAEVPFAGIIADLLTANLTQRPEKREVFETMRGAAAIELDDIETAVTLVFAEGKLRIEKGIAGNPEIVIRTTSDRVMDLNALRIVGGLPWYFDEAGRRVLGHLFAGKLKISGMFVHLALLTRLTKIMSVI